MFTKWNPWVLFDQSLYNLGLNVTEVHVLAISMVALLLVDWIKYKKGKGIEVFLEEQLFMVSLVDYIGNDFWDNYIWRIWAGFFSLCVHLFPVLELLVRRV